MNKKLKRLATAVGAGILSLAVSAQPALANGYPFQEKTLEEVAGMVIRYVMGLGAIIALAFLVLGGVAYIYSGGDKIKVQEAQGKITSAIIGLVVVLGGYLIIKAVCAATGLEGSVWCNI